MITVVRFTLATRPAANRGPASVAQDLVDSLYNACTGVRTADVAHNASGLPPFRLGAVTVADAGAQATAAVTVLDDGCLARVLAMKGRRLNPSVAAADVQVAAATTWARPLELGSRVRQPVELLHIPPPVLHATRHRGLRARRRGAAPLGPPHLARVLRHGVAVGARGQRLRGRGGRAGRDTRGNAAGLPAGVRGQRGLPRWHQRRLKRWRARERCSSPRAGWVSAGAWRGVAEGRKQGTPTVPWLLRRISWRPPHPLLLRTMPEWALRPPTPSRAASPGACVATPDVRAGPCDYRIRRRSRDS